MANKKGIGYSPLTDKVYMGTQNQEKRMWVGEKTDVTQDFLAVAYAYFSENTIRDISCGKEHNLFINIKKDASSIERVIKNLQKKLSKLSKIKSTNTP